MNILLYVLFLSIFFLDWISFKLGALPRIATWLPEILSLVAAALVATLFATRKHFALKGKYLIFFSLLFLFILGGIIVNKVPSEVVNGFQKTHIFGEKRILLSIDKFSVGMYSWCGQNACLRDMYRQA
jgi:uncharacterized membrane protein YjdF